MKLVGLKNNLEWQISGLKKSLWVLLYLTNLPEFPLISAEMAQYKMVWAPSLGYFENIKPKTFHKNCEVSDVCRSRFVWDNPGNAIFTVTGIFSSFSLRDKATVKIEFINFEFIYESNRREMFVWEAKWSKLARSPIIAFYLILK